MERTRRDGERVRLRSMAQSFSTSNEVFLGAQTVIALDPWISENSTVPLN